ncbi:Putative carboxylesterase, type B, carboxylesterase type B, alpha/Beta hydrolase [Colletotrichum destructivum]|uniref:Carboxylesterase, type B, carboxylesterase type B, alpha/Beta hydrolase n=1 Tax=Colletotrichum destructivum TaxID=34406 RepID=A0AAX4ID50_9PEZI|nr:Putative carboxylesterase, type B, carboxylesterase type B, alpha/Beta hydrolase [Colletotrichum destructivum]
MSTATDQGPSWQWALGLPLAAAGLLGYLWAGPNNGFTTNQHTGSKYSPAASVTINQGTVLGRLVTDGTFPEPVEGFMGIPYALPPVGQLRFRHAVPVPSGNDTLRAFELGPRCPGKQLVPFTNDEWLGPDWQSEDCLTINVYRPRGHTADEGGRKLPVAVMIPGGAFNRGAARMHNTPSMLAWSEEPWVGVSMQYRVGVAGGLNTALTEKEGLLNLGLKDMYVALEWVQENIAAFGGDPDDVTIMGLSAAAHGIGHLIMDVNQKKKLFHKAIMDSGGHTARVVHPPGSKLNEAHFQEFLELTGCGNRPEHEILPCLRALPSSTIIESGQTVYERSNPSVRWAWQPVLDGDIISRRPIDAWKSNRWNKVPILTGSAHNEGAMYVPRTASTPGDFTDFFRTLLPQLSEADLAELNALYPDPSTDPGSEYVETRPLDVGSQYKRAEAAYGHYAYTCPVRQTAVWGSRHAGDPPVYLYHWALNKTALYGANHGDQMRYQTYNAEVRSISPKQDEIAAAMHAYATSFIVHGDPNRFKARSDDGLPEWLPFGGGTQGEEAGKTMVLGEGNDERAGGSGLGTTARFAAYNWAEKECDFWWKLTEKFED